MTDEQIAVKCPQRRVGSVQRYQRGLRMMHTLRQHEEFQALLAHELLTPLSCILGWTQLAREQGNPDNVLCALDVIERNVRRQRRLLDELLTQFRFTHGQLSLSPERTTLWEQLDQQLILPQLAEPDTQMVINFNGDEDGDYASD